MRERNMQSSKVLAFLAGGAISVVGSCVYTLIRVAFVWVWNLVSAEKLAYFDGPGMAAGGLVFLAGGMIVFLVMAPTIDRLGDRYNEVR